MGLRNKSRITGIICLFFASTFAGGCASGMKTIAPEPPKKFERLGLAEGKACGSLGTAGTAYYFVPMWLNSRVDRAYDRALKSVPEATGLINVSLEESWFWWYIATTRCVTITGEAIREVNL